MIVLMLPASVMAAEAKVDLGSTETYAVLAGSAITNTGDTEIGGTIGGDIGIHPGSSVTGFPPGIFGGAPHFTDEDARIAKEDLVIAYNDAKSRIPTMDLTDQDLGGMTLTSGVYFFSSSAQLTGTLTLDGQGDPEAVFIFQIGSTLTTAPSSVVKLTNEARFCRVFWQVASSATLDTSSQFAGHIMAMASITVNDGVIVQGQLMAQTGAVTLINDRITNGICAAVAAATPTPTAEVTTTLTPTPAEAAAATTAAPTTTATTTTTAAPTTTSPLTATTTAAPTTVSETTETVIKTGEPGNIIFIVIGMSMLGLAGGLLLALQHSRRQTRAGSPNSDYRELNQKK